MDHLHPKRTRDLIVVVALATLLALLASCSDDSNPTGTTTNREPTVPTVGTGGPADGALDVALDAVLAWSSSDQDGDPLTYDVHFGTTNDPPLVSAGQSATTYAPTLAYGTTYYWKIVASDDATKATSSPVWHFSTVAEPTELVIGPNQPTGDTLGAVDAVLSFSVTGGSSDAGHALEYSFDWDDGTASAWTTAMPVTHAWSLAGTYDVTARARCIEHPAAVSGVSLPLQVTIEGPENVTAPMAPGGSQTPEVDIATNYSLYGAVSSRGHTLEYRVDWGDGTMSDWGPGGIVSRTWTTVDSYTIRAQARCLDHPDVESVWSTGLVVTVLAPETISTPDAPVGPATVYTGVTTRYDVTGAISSRDHQVDLRFDWGNGVITAWTYDDWGATRWLSVGTYDVKVQARCHDHIDILSEWSAATTVTVTEPPAETISAPEGLAGQTTGEINESLEFYADAATSSLGHAVSYNYDWGEGAPSTVEHLGTIAYHAWAAPGTYDVRIRAFCRDHPEYVSEWSAPLQVTITEPAETVSPPTYISGSASTVVDDPVEFRTYNASSNVGHTLEYRFDWGDGTFSTWGPTAGIYYTASHAWSATGTYDVRSQARCQEHPDLMSDWSTEMSEIVIAASETVPTPIWGGGLETETTEDLGWWLASFMREESSVGHLLEWYVDFGDGTFDDWSGNPSFSKRWLTTGDYTVRGRARCLDHPDILSDWSADLIVHVVELESIDGQPTLTGPTTATVGVPAVYTVSNVASSLGHELEYQLYDSYNDSVPGVAQGWTTADNLSMTWDVPGTRVLQVNARCVDHPELESVMSTHLWVTITD